MPSINRYTSPGDAIKAYVRAQINRLSIVSPGIIDSFDTDTKRAKVIPSFQERDSMGTFHDRLPISGVPVLMVGGQNGRVLIAPTKGDPCLLLWSQCALDEWKINPALTVPKLRGASYRVPDVICITGFLQNTESIPAEEGIHVQTEHLLRLTGEKVVVNHDESVPDEAGIHVNTDATIHLTAPTVMINNDEASGFEERIATLEANLAHLVTWARQPRNSRGAYSPPN